MGGATLEWHRFAGMIEAPAAFPDQPCVYVQADRHGRPVRVGKASEGLVARYRGGTGWALEAAEHDSGNIVFVTAIPKEQCEAVEATLIWEHRDALVYNNVGKLRPPETAAEVVHHGEVPTGWGQEDSGLRC